MRNSAIRRVWLPPLRVLWMLFGLSLLIGITGVLLQQAPG